MKKQSGIFLLVVAAVLTAGLTGFFIGRNTGHADVVVSKYESHSTTVPSAADGETETTAPLMVNINTATSEELQRLPGIGPVLAQRIIDYREENGPFETVSELTLVSGIGISKLEEILDYVTVGG